MADCTYHFAVDLEVAKAEERLDVGIFERDEAKSFAAPSLAVKHDGRVDDLAELGEEFAHRV